MTGCRRVRFTSGLHFADRGLISSSCGHARLKGPEFLPPETHLRYLFADYVLDTNRRELHRGSDLVSVTPQVFDLLAYLLLNRERVVSKDEIIAAVWGGRIVSDAAVTTRLNVARSAIGDCGDAQRLIKTLPRKGMRFVGTVRLEQAAEPARAEEASRPDPSDAPSRSENVTRRGYRSIGRDAFPDANETRAALAVPDRPSIAILPFANLTRDPEQEYFADGVVEDITVGLSRMRWLLVIARNSSFTYKGRPIDVKQVGGELGVRYVVEGSVRKASGRVRITAQLIDAATGAHLWADRFEGALRSIFHLQDRVSESIVGAIAPRLELHEIERARSKPTESLDAYDYFLRGKANVHLGTSESHSEALRLFYRAIELDPEFASAYGMAAWCYTRRKASGWGTDSAEEIAETARVARRAVELAKDDAVALCTAGFALARVIGDLDDGAAFIQRAVELNPNLATAWLTSGWVRVLSRRPGRGDRASQACDASKSA